MPLYNTTAVISFNKSLPIQIPEVHVDGDNV